MLVRLFTRSRRGLPGLLVLVIAAGLLLPGARAASVPAQATTTPVAAPDALGGGPIPFTDLSPYGSNVFLHKEVEQAKIERTLQMAKDAGLLTLKQEFPWDEIEFKKGYFHDDKWNKSSWDKFDNIVATAEKYGITLVARIDHAPDWARLPDSSPGDHPRDPNDLADFVAAFLQHYNGRIKYVQVWNEPNLHGEWDDKGQVDPAGYVDLLKTVYTRAKQTDPNVVVLSAPMAITLEDWPKGDPQYRRNLNELIYWQEMYLDGVKGYFDILSANAYGLDQPPQAPPDPTVLNFRRVELLRDVMVRNGDAGKAIWFNEYGWNASPTTLAQSEQNLWRRVDPAVQAQWTVDGIAYARQHWPWAGVFFIWYLRQVGDIAPDKAEYYFQMLDPNFNPQPVYDAVKAAATGGTATPVAATPTLAVATLAAATPTLAGTLPTATAPPGTVVLTPVGTPTPAPGAAQSESSPWLLWLVLGGLLLVALGVGGSLLLRRRK